jgi:hypothetical protein
MYTSGQPLTYDFTLDQRNVLGTLGFQLLLSGTSEEILYRALPITVLVPVSFCRGCEYFSTVLCLCNRLRTGYGLSGEPQRFISGINAQRQQRSDGGGGISVCRVGINRKEECFMAYFHEKLSSSSLKERICWGSLLFLLLFFGLTIISYFFLPEGLLKNKNPLQNWETSNNTIVLTLQIFFYNLLSVLVIVLGSLLGTKKEKDADYLSLGYLAFYTLICVNAVVLGTWSFSVEDEPLSLPGRLLRIFDLAHRGGLWEMTGQLLIACSAAHIATVLTSGKNTVTKKIRDIRISRSERIAFVIGISLMLIGAIVESIAINMH